MTEAALIRGQGLTRYFGGIKAVQGVDIAIPRGEFRSIVGPNGAGKTTLFNMLARQIDVTAGDIWFKDKKITRVPSHDLPRLGISRTFQKTSLFTNLTIRENIRLAVQAKKISSYSMFRRADSYDDVSQSTQRIIDRLMLAPIADILVSETSHGDHRVAEVAVALGSDPDVLLLDEPMAGMSPVETERTVSILKELKKSITIVLIEHDMDVVLQLSDRVTVMDLGKVIAEGTAEEVQKDPAVQSAYLGVESQ